MTICALDLATTTGYASVSHGIVMSGTFKCRQSSKEPWGLCFLRFKRFLREWLIQEKPEQLWYEDVMRFSSNSAAKAYCGLRAVMLMECEAHGVEVRGLSVGTIKKTFAGSGKASKEDMIEAAWRHWKIKTASHDEADSLGILFTAIQNNPCTPPLTQPSKRSASATSCSVPT